MSVITAEKCLIAYCMERQAMLVTISHCSAFFIAFNYRAKLCLALICRLIIFIYSLCIFQPEDYEIKTISQLHKANSSIVEAILRFILLGDIGNINPRNY